MCFLELFNNLYLCFNVRIWRMFALVTSIHFCITLYTLLILYCWIFTHVLVIECAENYFFSHRQSKQSFLGRDSAMYIFGGSGRSCLQSQRQRDDRYCTQLCPRQWSSRLCRQQVVWQDHPGMSGHNGILWPRNTNIILRSCKSML